jgi:hypothetical protein
MVLLWAGDGEVVLVVMKSCVLGGLLGTCGQLHPTHASMH